MRGLGSRAVWFGFWSLTCESDWKGYAGGVLWLDLALAGFGGGLFWCVWFAGFLRPVDRLIEADFEGC